MITAVMAVIRGEVSGFQQRSEQVNTGTGPRFIYVWDFRIEQRDPAGKAMPRAAIEMRGTSFSGSVNNGDTVEVEGSFKSGELLRPSEIRNLTSGIIVAAHGERALRRSKWIGLLVFLIFGTLVVAAFLLFASFAGKW
jgi:hypothetical protein